MGSVAQVKFRRNVLCKVTFKIPLRIIFHNVLFLFPKVFINSLNKRLAFLITFRNILLF